MTVQNNINIKIKQFEQLNPSIKVVKLDKNLIILTDNEPSKLRYPKGVYYSKKFLSNLYSIPCFTLEYISWESFININNELYD